MSWKRGNPGCPCCVDVPSSSSISSSSISSSSISSSSISSSSIIDPCDCSNLPATLILKIEIQDFVPFVYDRHPTLQCTKWLEWSTLDDINGTYLFPIERHCDINPPSFTLPPTQAIAYSTRTAYNFAGDVLSVDPWLRVQWTRLQDQSGGLLGIQSFNSDPNTAIVSERDIIIGASIQTPTCLNYSDLVDVRTAETLYRNQSPCTYTTGAIPGQVTLSIIAGEL